MKKNNIIIKNGKKEIKLTAEEYRCISNKIFNDITETLIRGEKVKLRGFGTLTIKLHKSKNGRNPKTGEKILIPDKKAVRFIISKNLKAMIETHCQPQEAN